MTKDDLISLPRQSIDDLLACIQILAEYYYKDNNEEKDRKLAYVERLSKSALETFKNSNETK